MTPQLDTFPAAPGLRLMGYRHRAEDYHTKTPVASLPLRFYMATPTLAGRRTA